MALLALAVVLLAAGVGAVMMVGRPVDAPPWLRAKIEERIAQTVPGIDVEFGRMSLLVQRSGLARVILWDVEILNSHGGQIAALSDIEAGLAPGALLRGQLELREAQVSGAFVTLQRDEQGRLGLALGDVFSENTDMPDVTDILAQIDQAMLDPRLAQLDLFEADALTVRYEDRRARKGWTADGGRLRLQRKDGELQLSGDVALLGGGDGVATVSLNAASEIGKTELSFGLSFDDLGSHDIATQTPALAWLKELDAPISGSLRSRMREDGTLGVLNATLQIGKGALQPNLATRAVPFDGARTYFAYDPETAILSFDEISVSSSLGQIVAEGQAQLQGLDRGWPSALTGQFKLSDIKLTKGTIFERDLAVSGAEMAFKLLLDPFQLTLGELRVTDPDFPVVVKGDLLARADGWAIALDALVAKSTAKQVLSFWPTSFRPKPRKWVADNVKSGVVSDVTFSLRAEPEEKPKTYVDFRFSQGSVTVNRALPAVSGAEGRLAIYGGRLSLRLDEGHMTPKQGGTIDLTGSEFIIPDMRQKPATGVLNLVAESSVEAALALLDNDIWRVLRKIDRPVDLASGQGAVTGVISLPLVKGTKLPDIDIALRGRIRDAISTKLVPNHTFSAKALDLTVSNSAVSLTGAAELSGVPANGRWEQSLTGGPGQVAAEVTISPQTMAALGVALPKGMVSGQGLGQFRLELKKDQAPAFTLQSGLRGIGLTIPPLGWRLTRDTGGDFRVAGTLGKPISVESLSLDAAGLKAQGSLSLTQSGAFEKLNIASLRLGSWLDVAGLLKGRGAGKTPLLEVTSGRVDLRQATFGSGQSGAGRGGAGAPEGGPMAITLEQLRVTDTITMQNFRGNFDSSNGLEGRFDASLGKRADIQGRVVPQNGRSAFRITGEDAGDILRDTGYLKTVSDGSFRLDLAPVKGTTGSYDGKLRVEGTRLRDAPAIGALLDAISIVGLLDQLNGPGIFFSDVEADFRLTPDQVILKQASAVGPSMGISMDGFYDLGSGRMDMQGVLSPIYFVNGIGRLIARKGEGLIGFNFNLTGQVDNPRVAVNPLSVLTPGMFRDIFRRPPPKVSQ
ncbi:MAG: AsmA-like C-terminal region-containing protein [Pelagimonas sp.]|uniref:YhdP family protein n=1 Tax=Pelagimonas sp. TaxID=2073170 RepID=UPI003D6C159A